ncbi:MAG: class I SAM-dependent methyltransferase [Anaerolineales bacterium]|nr:MAG: class I SAM-dependent methyltransferase [Anaerolineales bacterium]
MGNTSPKLNPELVYDLFGGIFKPQIIRLALQLDVFTPLAAGSTSAEQVAQSCHCDAIGIKSLLDYLCGLQVLECHGNIYALTPTAATFLVKGRKAYVGDMILHYTDTALFDNIQQSLRSGKPSSLGEDFVQDAWLESYLPWRIPKSLEMWQAAGISTEHRENLRILDIACGCAIKSLALAQATPTVRVTCLDAADVLVVARDLAERMGVESQVAFEPANLLDASLGENQFDAILTGQITHYLTKADNASLFNRVYSALSPNGVLVVDCPMAADKPTETTSFLTLLLWANSGGAAHSFEMYRAWLSDSGFRHIKQLSQRLLVAIK